MQYLSSRITIITPPTASIFDIEKGIKDRCSVYVDGTTFSLPPPETTEQTLDYAGIASTQLFIAPPITKRVWPSHRLNGKPLAIPTTKTPESELNILLVHLKNKKKELEEAQEYYDKKTEKNGQWNRWKEEVLANQRFRRAAEAAAREINDVKIETKNVEIDSGFT